MRSSTLSLISSWISSQSCLTHTLLTPHPHLSHTTPTPHIMPHSHLTHSSQRVQLEAYHRDRLLERVVDNWREAAQAKKRREEKVGVHPMSATAIILDYHLA